ncbi:MAG: RDD family protein [bacterium]
MPVREQSATETIVSADHVEIQYDLAGIGSRAIAMFIDSTIIYSALAIIILFFVLAAGTATSLSDSADVWVLAILLFVLFIVHWGYFSLFEAFNNGQTPGKRLVGIRVIREGGYSLTFMTAMIRNLIRVVDALPLFYGVGVAFVMLTPFQRRLGDMVAGTLVVKESSSQPKQFSRAWMSQESGVATADRPRFVLDVGDMELLQSFASRRTNLPRDIRDDLAAKLLERIRAHTTLPADVEGALGAAAPEAILLELLGRAKAL